MFIVLVKVKVAQSCPTLRTHGLYSPCNSPGQNTGVGSFSLLQGIFPTQGSNPGLLHCRRILYQLNHKGSPLSSYPHHYSNGEKNIKHTDSVVGIGNISSVQFSLSVVSDSLRHNGLQCTRLSCPSPTPRASSNSCLSSLWCHPTVSSFVVPFSSCPRSFPATGSFPVSQFFTSGGQSTGTSASASVLAMNI